MKQSNTKIIENEQLIDELLENSEMFISAINEDKVYSCISSIGIRSGLIRYIGIHAFIVYVFLLSHYNKVTGESFPSYNTIRESCGIGTNSIQMALRKLTTLGLIDIRRSNREKANFIYTLYHVNLANLSLDGLECIDTDIDENLTKDEESNMLNSLIDEKESGELWDML
jgi:predicted transcriptional regulator